MKGISRDLELGVEHVELEPGSARKRTRSGGLILPASGKTQVKYIWRFHEVSWNRGTPRSAILIGFPVRSHPFGGTTILGNPHMMKWDICSKFNCVWYGGLSHICQGGFKSHDFREISSSYWQDAIIHAVTCFWQRHLLRSPCATDAPAVFWIGPRTRADRSHLWGTEMLVIGPGVGKCPFLGILNITETNICWRWNKPNSWEMWNIGTFTNPCWRDPVAAHMFDFPSWVPWPHQLSICCSHGGYRWHRSTSGRGQRMGQDCCCETRS